MEQPPSAYEFGPFRLEPRRRRLERNGTAVALTPKVFDTLLLLVERRGTVVSKDEMLSSLWPDAIVEENNLGQAISKVRQALGEVPGANHYIVTLPGRGYSFIAGTKVIDELRELPPPEPVVADASQGQAERSAVRQRVLGIALIAAVIVGGYFLWSNRMASDRFGRPTSLAVLPFKPLESASRDDALQLGIADSLIGHLAALEGVSVRSLGTVRHYSDPSVNPLDAGRALGVDAVLDGHIQRLDQRVRITVRLLRVADGFQLWSGQFDEGFGSVFDIQSSIAQRAADALASKLDPSASQRIEKHSTSDAGAYESYLRGRFFISIAQPQNAIRMFEAAIGRDPQYALAHAGLADIFSRVPVATDGPSAGPLARARASARQAMALDPDLADAHTALGWIAFYHDWDWAESQQRFLRAMELNPGDFSAHVGLAHVLSNSGRSEEALRQIDRAIALEPTSPLAAALKAQFLFYAGRNRDATELSWQTSKAAPGFWIASLVRGRVHLREKDFPSALQEFASARQSGGTHGPLALTGYTHAVAGDHAAAGKVLRDLIAAGQHSYVPPYYIALVHHAMGREPEALTWLERAQAERDVRLVFLPIDPLWDGLRTAPRFQAVVASLRPAPSHQSPTAATGK